MGSAAIYIITQISFTGMGLHNSAKDNQGDTAIAMAFIANGQPWMAQIVYISALIGILATCITSIMAQARVF